MAEYDGSVKIKYDAQTQDFNKSTRKAAENAVRSIDEVKNRVENLRRAKEALEKAGTPKDATVYQNTIKELQKWEEELSKVEADQKKAAESTNYFKREITKYEETLKTLGEQGQWHGDEEYDQAYASLERLKAFLKVYEKEVVTATDNQGLFNAEIAKMKTYIADMERVGIGEGNADYDQALIDLQNLIDKQKEYRQNLMNQTDKAKGFRAQKELEAQQRLEQEEEKRRQKEEARLNAILQKEEQKRAKEAAAMAAQEQEENRLRAIKESSTVVDQEIIQLAERRKQLLTEIRQLEDAGVGYGYQEYDDKQSELTAIEAQLTSYADHVRKAAKQVQSGFRKMADSSKNMASEMGRNTSKASSLLGRFASRFKGIMLSLLVFNWITKGFNAMVSAMKEGFKNLAHYSSDYNTAMSNMQSQAAQLKNNLAAAFAPVVTMIIPYITQLISWLNTACNALSRFLALVGGKSTYTVAKKQVIDYAKSLDSAGQSAKGALAAFDDINVLEKQNGGEAGGGGEVTGADAFEEVSIGQEAISRFEMLKALLEPLMNWILLQLIPAVVHFGEIIGEIALDILGYLQPVLSWLWQYLVQPVIVWLGEYIPKGINGIADILSKLWNELLKPFIDWFITNVFPIISPILDAIADAIQMLLYAFSSIIDSVIGVFSGLIDFLAGVFTGNWELAWQGIEEIGRNIWSIIVTVITTSAEITYRIVSTVLNAIKEIWLAIWNFISEIAIEIWEAIKQFIVEKITMIKLGIELTMTGIKIFWSMVWNAIKVVVSSILGSIGNFISDRINFIKACFTIALSAIKTLWGNTFGNIKLVASTLMNSIKALISIGLSGIADKWKSILGSLLSGAKDKFEAIRETVHNAIENIKSFFNFEWSLPHLKLPHFSISGSFSLNPPSVPSFGIDWYKNGGIMTHPTIFGFNGSNLMAGGEPVTGGEAILPLDQFYENLESILSRYARSDSPVYLQINGETFARLLGPYMDAESSRIGMSFVKA